MSVQSQEMSAMVWMAIVLGASILSLLIAVLVARMVMAKDTGTDTMRSISDAIREGAEAFMSRQYKTIGWLAVILAAIIFVLYAFVRQLNRVEQAQHFTQMGLAIATVASFILGALCSAIAGYLGMWIAIRSNIRTASAARTSLNSALQIALRGGAVSGIFVVAMSLLGVGGLYTLLLYTFHVSETQIPFMIVGYGFGASFVALFAQLGGGIYTKAADVGADLVGKVEAGIPEDDPRNPAVIADLVGDNVGDCAGRGADLFESTAGENIGAMILGVALVNYGHYSPLVILFPLVARAFGLLASIVGVFVVRTAEDADPMEALNRGYYVSALLAAVGFGVASYLLLNNPAYPNAWARYFSCGIVGILASVVFVYITQYYTEYKYRPVREIAEASQTGPATNVITGVAVGFESTALPVITIAVAILLCYWLGESSGLPARANPGLFGIAVGTMGMLGTAAYILAMDTFGPITDNAGGIVEMSQQPEDIRKKTDRLDAVGNTTKALTKGYAIGSAALAAFLLFSAYIEEVNNYGFHLTSVDLAKPSVFVGALMGGMLVFLFSSLAIRAVGKAAYYVINEVRRQFKENAGILAGTAKPDYGRCVDIVTIGSLKMMVLPGVLAVGMPIAVGVIFRLVFHEGAEVVAALLMVGTIVGILMATFLNNSGGAWDNAKKYIETGAFGGKRSDPHKAAVVGDTVGDPFKDTAGPSLHVLIKLLATVTLVLAPLFVGTLS
ncbi:MAG TPA: sodium-translocating pyrophosphatase [Myxococcales bacterium]|nr:sodium-translocating pyrophosphatase [Myxococcales bacterium]